MQGPKEMTKTNVDMGNKEKMVVCKEVKIMKKMGTVMVQRTKQQYKCLTVRTQMVISYDTVRRKNL